MAVPTELGLTRIRVAPQVIDPAELVDRVAAILERVDTRSIDLSQPPRRSAPKPYIEASRRADALHALWDTVAAPGIAPTTGLRGLGQRFVKKSVRRLTHWYVEPRFAAQHEIDAELARFATDSVLAIRRTHTELTDARREVESLRRESQNARRELESMKAESTRAAGILDRLLEISGSGEQLARLQDQVSQLMTRLGIASARGASFDYVAFEDKFRGSSSDLAMVQRDYVSKFPPSAEPGIIADVGCGRGEMLETLREFGHEVIGVDLDSNMIAVCTGKGLPVVQGDGVNWLENASSLKGVFSAQVIEHLLTPEIERFLTAALRALRPGGVLVVETINPRSLHALANHFFADLSHVRPIHPETLRFMCEQIGFRDVALMELSPHPTLAASAELGPGATEGLVKDLVASVFGFQDYAVVATK